MMTMTMIITDNHCLLSDRANLPIVMIMTMTRTIATTMTMTTMTKMKRREVAEK